MEKNSDCREPLRFGIGSSGTSRSDRIHRRRWFHRLFGIVRNGRFGERWAADAGGQKAETILKPRRSAGLKGTSVNVSDVSEEGCGRGEKRGGGSGGRRRRRWRWRRMTLRLGLSVVRWTISVYAAMMESYSSHEQLLFHRSLMSKLFQSQLVLSLPFRSVAKGCVSMNRRTR